MTPPDPKPLLRAGIAAQKRGDTEEAEAIFRQVLRVWPGHPHGLHLLGVVTNAQGDHRQAVKLIAKALRTLGDKPNVHNNFGIALERSGQRAKARAAYGTALKLKPDYAKAHYNLAKLLLEDGDLAGAKDHYRHAVRSEPALAEAWLGLARTRRLLDELPAAMACYQKTLELDPDDVVALIELAALYQLTLETPKSVPLLKRACRLAPDNPTAAFNLAQALADLGHVEKAEEAHRRVLELEPEYLHSRLAVAKAERDRGDWSHWEEVTARLQALGDQPLADAPAPFLLNLFPVPQETHRAVARAYSRSFEAKAQRLGGAVSSKKPETKEKLRLGFLSADFRQHPVGYLTHRLFAEIDRRRFEVFAYSLLPAADPVTHLVEEGCDVFRSCARLSDQQVARRIADDGVDVLVDLTGYTTYSRPTILALAPAPMAVQHTGYVNTLGASFVGWQVVDPIVVGPEQRPYFSERLIYLPGCLFPVSPLGALAATADPPPPRTDFGLPEGVPLLCSFNAPHKLDPPTFDAWAEILRRVPEALLWLYDGDRPELPALLRREAANRGVAGERLHFAGKAPYPRHLARYRLADLFLDSHVYNGGATAVDALRGGLPVLTCPGKGPLARMGASIVTAAGLGDLVAATPEAYVEAAVEIASSPELARRWRQKAEAAKSSPLFDLAGWARAYEAGLWEAWQRTASGEPGDVDVRRLGADPKETP